MKSKTENALELFRGGMNCAQAVVLVFGEEHGIDRETAARISCGFGGGMGRLQETCGAVTGSFMVLGLSICGKVTSNRERKERTYSAIQKFSEKFNAMNGTMNCRLLMKADLRTEEGLKEIEEKNLTGVVCEKCISDAISIVEELI